MITESPRYKDGNIAMEGDLIDIDGTKYITLGVLSTRGIQVATPENPTRVYASPSANLFILIKRSET